MAAAIASPAPRTVLQRRQHPPYKAMILRAIESLRDRDGSSRPAISKFISATFSDLPPTHNALLSTHLRRLKSNGVLSMVKHSYKLASHAGTPVSAKLRNPPPDPATSLPKKRGRPPKSPSGAVYKPGRRSRKMTLLAEAAALMERERPARPRKPTDGAAPVDVSMLEGKRKRGRGAPGMLGFPRGLKLGIGSLHAYANTLVGKRKPGEAIRKVWMENGTLKVTVENEKPGRVKRVVKPRLDSMPVVEKRKPGRPKRTVQPGFNQVAGAVGAPDGKRKLGRQKRVVQPGLSFMPGAVTALDGKRKPGWQKKVVQPGLSSMPGAMSALDGKKKPGRPKRVVRPGLIFMPRVVSASAGKRKAGRPKRFVPPGLDSMPGVVSASDGKRKPGRPKRIEQPGLNSTPGAVGEGKRKPGQPKRVAQPDLISTPGAMSTPDGKRKPGRPKRLVQPGLSSTPGAVIASDGKRKMGRPKRFVQSDLNLTPGAVGASDGKRKPGRPRKIIIPNSSSTQVVIGSVTLLKPLQQTPGKVGSTEKRKQKRTRKSVGQAEPGLGLMTQSVSSSAEKKKPGRPRKLPAPPSSAVALGDNATLSGPVHPSSGMTAGEVVLGPDPMPAAVNALVEMKNTVNQTRKPISSSLIGEDNATLLNPLQQSSGKAAGEVALGAGPTDAALDVPTDNSKLGRPRKLDSSTFPSTNAVNGSVMLPDPLQQSLGNVASTETRKPGHPRKAAGEAESGLYLMPQAVITSIEKRKPGRPPKFSVSSSSVLAVGENATLSSSVQTSPGNVEGNNNFPSI